MASANLWDNERNINYTGGGLYTPQPNANNMFSGMIGNTVGPMYGQLANQMGLDRILMAMLTGNNAFSTRGQQYGVQAPTSNAMFNAIDNSHYNNMFGAFSQGMDNTRKDLLTNYYIKTGMTEDTAKTRAASAINSSLNPMGLLTKMAAGGYEEAQMQAGFSRSAFYQGLHGGVPMVPGGMPHAYNADITRWQSDRGTKMGAVFGAIGRDYIAQPSTYGNMSGGDVGYITSEVTRSGAVNKELSTMFDSKSSHKSIEAASASISRKVKEYSQALAPLKEILGGDIPSLMKSMDQMFGVNAMATYSPGQLQSYALNMKHMSALTGTSAQNMIAMAQTAQGYLNQSYGGSAMGGGAVAMNTAAMLGAPGVSMARMNEDQFRGTVLKTNAALQAGQRAQDISGAYAMFVEQRGGADSIANREAFKGVLAANGANINKLAGAIGVSMQDIRGAGKSERAEDLLTNPENAFLTDAAGNETYSIYKRKSGRGIGQILKGYGVSASAAEIDSLDMSDPDSVKKFLSSKGVSADKQVAIMGRMGESANWAGRNTFGVGFRQVEAMNKARQNKQITDKMVKARSDFETEFTAKFSKIGGMAGVLDSIMHGDKKKGLELGSLVSAYTGVLNIGDMGAVGKAYAALGEDDTKRTEFRGGMEIAMSGLDESGKLIEDKNFKANRTEFLKTGSAASLKEMLKFTKEGRRTSTLEKVGLGKEYEAAKGEQDKGDIIARYGVSQAAKDAKIGGLTDPEVKDRLAAMRTAKPGQKDFTLDEMLDFSGGNIKKIDVSEAERKKLSAGYTDKLSAVGMAPAQHGLEYFIKEIFNTITQLNSKIPNFGGG